MRTLRRPMFKLGGQAKEGNTGIMDGLVDREQLQEGTFYPDSRPQGYYHREEAGDPTPANTKEYRDFLEKKMYPDNIIGGLSRATGMMGDAAFNYGIKPLANLSQYILPLSNTRVQSKDYVKDNIDNILRSKGLIDEDGSNIEEQSAASTGDGNNPFGLKDDKPKSNLDVKEQYQSEQEALLARAKEFEELLNPGARKRVITNALAAASGSFGQSKGNTLQDIGNAISAAAGATGKMDENKQLAAKLAIEESVKQGIAEKQYRPNQIESLYEKYSSLKNDKGEPLYTPEQIIKKISGKGGESLGQKVNLFGSTDRGYREYVIENYPNVKQTFSGDEKSIEKINPAELDNGTYYIAPPEDTFFEVQDGKKISETPRSKAD